MDISFESPGLAPGAFFRWTSAPRFAERNVMERGAPSRLYYGLLLAARIPLPHFSVSSAVSLPKWLGGPGSTVPPRSTRRALILGSARPALISLLSPFTISLGVFLGAPTPNHTLASYPVTKSPTGGTSGRA